MAEPKVGMKFSSYKEVLSNAQKNKQVQSVESYNKENGRVSTNIRLTTGSLFMEEGVKSSERRYTDVEYCNDNFMYRGHSDYADGQYTRFSEIYGTNTYAKDLNGNGIVDKGEIFKNK